jgi:hypothetical protein
MVYWDPEYRALEHQANEFAANLLMPLNDFRKQISNHHQPSLDEIGRCAERYGVSLISCCLRWLTYTQSPSILVLIRDGYILWARSSEVAFKRNLFIKTVGVSPREAPRQSAHAVCLGNENSVSAIPHSSEVWLGKPCQEYAVVSSQYDFTISLIHFSNSKDGAWHDNEEVTDTLDHFQSRNR